MYLSYKIFKIHGQFFKNGHAKLVFKLVSAKNGNTHTTTIFIGARSMQTNFANSWVFIIKVEYLHGTIAMT